jgi:hypothetical protein
MLVTPGHGDYKMATVTQHPNVSIVMNVTVLNVTEKNYMNIILVDTPWQWSMVLQILA